MDISPPAAAPARAWTALGWVLCALASVMSGLAVAFALGDGVQPNGDLALDCVLGVGNGLLGAFVLTRYPRHPIGWLFVLSGFVRAVAAAAEAWSRRVLATEPGSLPGGSFASWLDALDQTMPLLAAGKPRLRTQRLLPTHDAAKAHALLDTAQAHQKLILTTG